METETIMSIIAIIVGIIIMACPIIGVAASAVIFGIAFIIWGVLTLLSSYLIESVDGPYAISGIIIGLLMIIFGAALIFSPALFTAVVSILIYIVGILLIILGIIAIFASSNKTSGVVAIVVGIIYLLLGYLVSDPTVFGILIGLGILITGILGLLYR